MIQLEKINTLPPNHLKAIGWNWLIGQDTLPYITNEMVVVTEAEAENYYEAANQLYEMFVKAGQYVIDKQLLTKMGIPENLHQLIKFSWDDDSHQWHLYGRFDLAGGIDSKPIKLIEFNANTATCIPETAIIQSAQLVAAGLDQEKQFNTVYESLVENFKRLRSMNPDLDARLLLSGMEGYPEDDTNIEVLATAARDAGFYADTAYIENVEFSADNGIFKYNSETDTSEQFDFWFSLVPWEFIGWDEPELAEILTQIITKRRAVAINPPYTLIFQSKYILKILWDLFPNHPLLLQTSDKPLVNKKQVEKVFLGREGANVRILNTNGQTHTWRGGEYEEQDKIYQEFVEFAKDVAANYYQAGVFFAYEGCGLGFRRGSEILDNQAQFCGHKIL
jgi:glutathionylspermidine synthase